MSWMKSQSKLNKNDSSRGAEIIGKLESISRTIEKAHLVGDGGNCGYAAIAINSELFGNKGKLIFVVNKALWEWSQKVEGRSFGGGHVVVKYLGEYFDSRGWIDEALAEDSAFTSDADLPDDFAENNSLSEDESYEFLHIPVGKAFVKINFDMDGLAESEIRLSRANAKILAGKK